MRIKLIMDFTDCPSRYPLTQANGVLQILKYRPELRTIRLHLTYVDPIGEQQGRLRSTGFARSLVGPQSVALEAGAHETSHCVRAVL